jgi:hypothetical protein
MGSEKPAGVFGTTPMERAGTSKNKNETNASFRADPRMLPCPSGRFHF